MNKINSVASLRAAILELEQKQLEEGILLKAQFHSTYESIKPINIIMKTFRDAAVSNELKTDIVSASVGLGAGYVSKLLFQGVMHSPARKVLGSALMMGITNFVSKNPELVKALGNRILNVIRRKPVHGEIESDRKPTGSS